MHRKHSTISINFFEAYLMPRPQKSPLTNVVDARNPFHRRLFESTRRVHKDGKNLDKCDKIVVENRAVRGIKKALKAAWLLALRAKHVMGVEPV